MGPLTETSPRPKGRPRLAPLTPMREATAKSMTKLAEDMKASHPEMSAHQHVRDAARMLRSGNEEAAQRHLRGAMFSLSPQSVHRHGIHTDDGMIAARQAMHSVHRHLLLVKDIEDVGAKNRAAIQRHAGEDEAASPLPPVPPARVDPNAGYGPGALAQKPTARQPGGDRAMNAPARTNSGGPDPAVADPAGPQPKGPRQFARTWGELLSVIDLAWIASPSKGEWAAIDAKSGHSLPDAKDGDDEDKADAHIRAARQATQIGQHAVAIKHLARASALTSDPGKQAAVNTLRGAVAKNAALRGQSQQLVNLSAETGRLAVTPAPYGRPGGPGLYGVHGLKHSDYLEQVVQALMKRGMDKGKATAIARGSIRKWMAKSKHPEVRAAAGVAEAQEIAAQARAHAHAVTWDDVATVIELTSAEVHAKAHATASATARAHAIAELRGPHGHWIREDASFQIGDKTRLEAAAVGRRASAIRLHDHVIHYKAEMDPARGGMVARVRPGEVVALQHHYEGGKGTHTSFDADQWKPVKVRNKKTRYTDTTLRLDDGEEVTSSMKDGSSVRLFPREDVAAAKKLAAAPRPPAPAKTAAPLRPAAKTVALAEYDAEYDAAHAHARSWGELAGVVVDLAAAGR